MKSQHEKGPTFERKVCGILSSWLTKGEKMDLFHRNVLSGGQYTSSQSLRGTPGDLAAAHPVGYDFCEKFVIECKHWRDLQFTQFLQKKGELYKALEKVRREAQQTNKDWLMIVRQNNQPIMVFFPVLSRPLFSWWTNSDPVHHFFLGDNPCYMVQLDHLLKYDPADLLASVNRTSMIKSE